MENGKFWRVKEYGRTSLASVSPSHSGVSLYTRNEKADI